MPVNPQKSLQRLALRPVTIVNPAFVLRSERLLCCARFDRSTAPEISLLPHSDTPALHCPKPTRTHSSFPGLAAPVPARLPPPSIPSFACPSAVPSGCHRGSTADTQTRKLPCRSCAIIFWERRHQCSPRKSPAHPRFRPND